MGISWLNPHHKASPTSPLRLLFLCTSALTSWIFCKPPVGESRNEMTISWEFHANLNWILLDVNDFMGFFHVTLLVMGFDGDLLGKKSGDDGNQMGLAKNKGCNGHIMGIYRDLVRCSWGYTNIYDLSASANESFNIQQASTRIFSHVWKWRY